MDNSFILISLCNRVKYAFHPECKIPLLNLVTVSGSVLPKVCLQMIAQSHLASRNLLLRMNDIIKYKVQIETVMFIEKPL